MDLVLDVDLSLSGLVILSNATLRLSNGRHYGLVGRNGVGKSTLLRAIASKSLKGMERYHAVIGHLEQELADTDVTCLESVLDADRVRTVLLKQASEIPEDDHRYKELYEKMELAGIADSVPRAASILSGLGFDSVMQQKKVRDFSGGWRMRVALARALFVKPDLLLLDEPTNHLDIPTVIWLAKYLVAWKGTVLVVSHDREFLDDIATDVIYMHNGTLDSYPGNFSAFDRTKEERYKQIRREYDNQMTYRKHLQEYIDKWRYNASRAAQAQSKIKILEKLPILELPPEESQVSFDFADPDRVGNPVVQMNEVAFSYDKFHLSNVSLSLSHDAKVAIVGPNGAGKTTILKLLKGDIQPSSGSVQRNHKLRISFFAQHHIDALEGYDETPLQFLARTCPGFDDETYRRILGSFGLSGRIALRSMNTLSGGQKSRVVFAKMALIKPSMLIFDEPTNHLDYDSVDSLSSSLKRYRGAVVIVSHDQRFIDNVCTEIWVCDKNTLTKFYGDSIRDYKNSLT